MANFDPTTAYRDDWKFTDFVEEAAWESQTPDAGPNILTGFRARRSDIDTPEMQSLAAGLALTSSAAAFVVWEPTAMNDDFDPKPGDRLRIADGGWVVRRVERSVFGRWAAVCEREKVDALT